MVMFRGKSFQKLEYVFFWGGGPDNREYNALTGHGGNLLPQKAPEV